MVLTINRRMFILATAKVVILGGIVSRLFFLQVKENKRYLTLSDKNRIREWKLPPIRGNFEDYFGNTIAGSRSPSTVSTVCASILAISVARPK